MSQAEAVPLVKAFLGFFLAVVLLTGGIGGAIHGAALLLAPVFGETPR